MKEEKSSKSASQGWLVEMIFAKSLVNNETIIIREPNDFDHLKRVIDEFLREHFEEKVWILEP